MLLKGAVKPVLSRFVVNYFSAKGDRGGSEGEEDLEEMTDSAEESEENEAEHTQPPVTTPTPSVRRPGECTPIPTPPSRVLNSYGKLY